MNGISRVSAVIATALMALTALTTVSVASERAPATGSEMSAETGLAMSNPEQVLDQDVYTNRAGPIRYQPSYNSTVVTWVPKDYRMIAECWTNGQGGRWLRVRYSIFRGFFYDLWLKPHSLPPQC